MLNADFSLCLDRPLNPEDIQKLLGNEFETDSAGYLEEDDDSIDFLENVNGSPNRNKFNFVNENYYLKKINEKKSDSFSKINSLDITENAQSSLISLEITNNEELNQILQGKYKNANYRYKLQYTDKEITNSEEEKEKVSILKIDQLLIVLKYLHCELHSGLIELSDNFTEERRKYFLIDHETYISIVNYFIKKKEEFFLCVLSDVMAKLNISQKVLDSTFFFYMNIAESDDESVINIKCAYDKVYHAGVK